MCLFTLLYFFKLSIGFGLGLGSVQSTGPVSHVKTLLHRLFVFAIRYAISQAGITA